MIIFFSGTGNSKFVAEKIATQLEDETLNLFEKIKAHDYSPIVSDRPWVIVTPTYAWQLPNIVKEWLSNTALNGNNEVYFVLTCGDSVGNAADFAKEYCATNNKKFKGLAKVDMPENYIAMFNAPKEDEARAIIENSLPVIDEIANAIRHSNKLKTTDSVIGKIQSGPINKLFYKYSIKDTPFRALDSCIGCGLCEKNCVMNNITLIDGKPSWHGNCTHCMACICGCPSAAIEYGKKSVGKPRYQCPNV